MLMSGWSPRVGEALDVSRRWCGDNYDPMFCINQMMHLTPSRASASRLYWFDGSKARIGLLPHYAHAHVMGLDARRFDSGFIL